MKFSFLRAIKFAFQDFFRNFWLSIVTISVLVLALLSINILISLNAISNSIISEVEKKVDISVFFQQDIEKEKIDNFVQRLDNMSEIQETVFISKQQAIEDFKEKHKDDPLMLEALNVVGENPLSDAVVVRAKNIEDYNKILNFINLEENQEIISYQNYTDHQKIIERVQVISNKVKILSIVLTVIFALIAILIVFNSIRVTIYTHREEIGVMKLVGANNWFVRLPFLLEGIIYAVFAMVITVVILYGALGAAQPHLAVFLDAYHFNLTDYYNQNFILLFGAELAATVILTVISSGVAIGKYLKV